MRASVIIKLGGREYSLLPAFSVWDEFEDHTGKSLLEHLQGLYNCSALIDHRARLIMLGLKAADPDRQWSIGRVKEAMFERGGWHEDLISIEADFMHRLLYTPEQYTEKKRQREEAEKLAREADDLLADSFADFSAQPPQI